MPWWSVLSVITSRKRTCLNACWGCKPRFRGRDLRSLRYDGRHSGRKSRWVRSPRSAAYCTRPTGKSFSSWGHSWAFLSGHWGVCFVGKNITIGHKVVKRGQNNNETCKRSLCNENWLRSRKIVCTLWAYTQSKTFQCSGPPVPGQPQTGENKLVTQRIILLSYTSINLFWQLFRP